ncbi:hypothetical protein SK875_B00450 [Burkholderia contaminans]|nr:hypothetical protein SK875_B00450 [Burkholderia contaminans]
MHMHNGYRYTLGAMACAPRVRLGGAAANETERRQRCEFW